MNVRGNSRYIVLSTATLWLALAQDFARDNVASLEVDRASILNLYKTLTALRRSLPQLVHGSYEPAAARGDVLLYRRRSVAGVLELRANEGVIWGRIKTTSALCAARRYRYRCA